MLGRHRRGVERPPHNQGQDNPQITAVHDLEARGPASGSGAGGVERGLNAARASGFEGMDEKSVLWLGTEFLAEPWNSVARGRGHGATGRPELTSRVWRHWLLWRHD